MCLWKPENRPPQQQIEATTLNLQVHAPLPAALAAARGRGGGCGRAWSSGHARAVAETAGCRLGSRRSRRRARLELRRRARAAAEGAHRQGMSPPGRSLGRLVGRSVGSSRAFDFLCWCALSGVVCGGWGSGFPCPRILDFMGVPPLFASRLLSWTLYVCACWHDSFVELRLAPRVPVSSSVSSWLARGIAIAGGSTRLLAVITRVPPRLAVRCALFSVFVGVGRFSGDNKIGRLFGGASLSGFAFGLRLRASPSGFAFGLRLRASPSGPPEATTRLRTHGRCPGSFPDSPQNTHDTPRSYLPRKTAVRCFGAFPALLVAIYLAETALPERFVHRQAR